MEGEAQQAQADKADTEFVELFAAPAAVAAPVTRECVIDLENVVGT